MIMLLITLYIFIYQGVIAIYIKKLHCDRERMENALESINQYFHCTKYFNFRIIKGRSDWPHLNLHTDFALIS